MSTNVNEDDTTGENERRGDSSGTTTVESYETADGVVFYDAENPLAWVEATRTIRLEDLA